MSLPCSAKLLLLYGALVSSAAAAVPLVAPSLIHFAALHLSRAYTLALGWLTPPYLYVVVNGIIITIAASSHFHKGGDARDVLIEEEQEEMVKYQDAVERSYEKAEEEEEVVKYEDAVTRPYERIEEETKEEADGAKIVGENDPFPTEINDGSKTEGIATRQLSGELLTVADVPTASARFGGRRTAKASLEGKSLKVARPRRSETLEGTWKMITDGRHVPLARHLKKSETWETQNARIREQLPSQALGEQRAKAVPLRREPSLGQEDLNRRVEAFIKKFNEDMRLQRQESLQRYWDKVNEGKQ